MKIFEFSRNVGIKCDLDSQIALKNNLQDGKFRNCETFMLNLDVKKILKQIRILDQVWSVLCCLKNNFQEDLNFKFKKSTQTQVIVNFGTNSVNATLNCHNSIPSQVGLK